MRFLILVVALTNVVPASAADPPRDKEPPIRVLFLGDNGPHKPRDRFTQLAPALARRGIELTYTDKLADLSAKTLSRYDGLAIYANTTRIEPAQERALLEYVASGGGLVALHCASYCFHNSDDYVKLVGAQFQRHGGQEFSTELAQVEHPILKGFGGFRSWDETYVHHRHNEQDREVLEYRREGAQAQGRRREPWTRVRTHGKGRVFYTAWGHDHRTFGHPGFANLVERGIRWACGRDVSAAAPYRDPDKFQPPEMTDPRKDVKPFTYVEAVGKIPNYTPGARWGTQGTPLTKMQAPLPAEESLKHYVTPAGFELRLFAAEPDIGKRIAMAWDERGRLWIAETVDYPNDLQPPGKGRDRIRICEDTNHDGRADKFTVFAEGLSIPTSLTFAYGGVVVHQAPHTLFLKDTDGDDQADVRRVLFTGWNTRDTHAGPSNLRYSLDNWLWGVQGYAGYNGQIAGQQRRFGMGFYRFRLEANAGEPQVTGFEFIRSTNNNTWGLGLSEEGVVFGSTANDNPSVHMPIANRYYEQVRGASAAQLGGIGSPTVVIVGENDPGTPVGFLQDDGLTPFKTMLPPLVEGDHRSLVDQPVELLQRNAVIALARSGDLEAAPGLGVPNLPHGGELVIRDHHPVPARFRF